MTDRSQLQRWGPGPWQGEPDDVAWADERTGLQCRILRHPDVGHLCGYVGVPPSHVLYGWDYEDHIKIKPEFLQGTTRDTGILDMFVYAMGGGREHGTMPVSMALKAHRGITYSGRWKDGLWYFGFDCGHAFDISPMMAHLYAELPLPGAVYRDLDYVKQNCTDLAFQLRQLEAARELTELGFELVKR